MAHPVERKGYAQQTLVSLSKGSLMLKVQEPSKRQTVSPAVDLGEEKAIITKNYD